MTTTNVIQAVLRRDRHRCRLCSGVATTAAYVLRPEFGGKLEEDNTLAVCRPCMLAQRADLGRLASYGGWLTVVLMPALST